VPGAWDVAPDLERILGEALFGTIWRRGGLSAVQREMITFARGAIDIAHDVFIHG
jgi:alkylhydroperoxidase/carboxymuconolactone decarboxylase family protein YurZ